MRSVASPARAGIRGGAETGAWRFALVVLLVAAASGTPVPRSVDDALAGDGGALDLDAPVPELVLDAPDAAQRGEVVEVALRLRAGAAPTGYEAMVVFDPAMLEVVLAEPGGTLPGAPGRERPLPPVVTAGAVWVASYACPTAACPREAPPSPLPDGTVAIVRFVALADGPIDVRLDRALLVSGDGLAAEPGATRWERLRPPPPDTSGDGRVDTGDVATVDERWVVEREAGCVDTCTSVADAAAVAASVTTAKSLAGSSTLTSTTLPLRTLVVDDLGDLSDAAGDGICRTSAGTCTLRAAIVEANRVAGHDLIAFAIPGSGVRTIVLASQLPALNDTQGVTIDGYTQSGASANTAADGSNAVILIEVRGTGPTGINGITTGVGNNVVRGLALYNFRNAVSMTGTTATGNRIVGNIIGTNAAATFQTPTSSGANGVTIQSGASDNVVGTPHPADRNVISGNGHQGVGLYGHPTARNVIQGNVFGLVPDGSAARPNQAHGVDINGVASETLVGGDGPGEGNVMSGNRLSGVEISHGYYTQRNRIVGNRLGTDLLGTSAPSFARNGQYGVNVEGAASCADCVRDVSFNEVLRNVVVNNGQGGVMVHKGAYANTIAGNRIGVLPNGVPAPNGVFGVRIEHGAEANVLGPGNEIAFNPTGVMVDSVGWSPNQPTPDVTPANTITANSIHDNNGLGIDLAPLGSVNREPGSTDPLVNGGIDTPVLSGVQAGSANGTACGGCRVEAFWADGASGAYGEGATFVAAATANAAGSFAIPLPAGSSGRVVTVAATAPDGGTSEFSRAETVPAAEGSNLPPNVVALADCAFDVCGFDGSGSSDPEGTALSYSWSIDGGAPVAGAQLRVTLAPGPHTAVLQVSDAGGAVATSTVEVVAEVRPDGLVAADSFTRTGAGWGSADIGGTWQRIAGTAERQDTAAGAGRFRHEAPGTSSDVTLPGTSTTDVDVRVDLALDRLPDGSFGHATGAIVRRQGNGESYRPRVRVGSGGTVYASLVRRTSTGSDAVVVDSVPIGLTYTPGAVLSMRATVTGTDPTTITVTIWPTGTAEPAPQLSVTDTTASLQGPGDVGMLSYLAGSSTTGPVTVSVFDFVAVAGASPAPPPPDNQAPTAAFTWTCAELTCDLDGSGSSDPDGTVASWAWDLGDGTTATGRSVTHTYPDAATRTVTLVVTDDDGATSSTSQSVTTTAPAEEEEVFVEDDFQRSVTNGWGSAPVGGAYSHVNPSSRYAVADGRGEFRLTSPGHTGEVLVKSSLRLDVDLRATVVSTQATGTFGSTVGFVVRHAGTGYDYRGRIRFAPDGSVRVSVVRRTGAVSDQQVGSEVVLPGLTAGQAIELRVTATGTNPTTITVTAWATGSAEPPPQLTVTDSTPQMQAAGAVGVTSYVGSGATNGATIRVDDLVAVAR